MRDLNLLKDFEALRIYLISTDDVLNWSFGEVTKPETINYRTFRPERDGLFDERIFGPVKDYQCYCGKYKGYRYKSVICDKCGVEVTHSRVRRERMGHIKLASPVVHVWFFKGIPSKMATLLDISPRNLESVIYFSSFIVTEFDPSKKAQAISKITEDTEVHVESMRNDYEDEITKLEDEIEVLESSKDFSAQENLLKMRQKLQVIRDAEAEKVREIEVHFRLIQKKIEGIELYSVMSDVEYINLSDYIDMFCRVAIGADAVKEILEGLDLNELSEQLRSDLERHKGQKALKTSKRLKVVEGFRKANIEPSRMVLNAVPVIPPEVRPMVQLEGGRFATSDANDLYRRVINRNNRLKKLLELGAPEIITRNEKRMLQEAVDALIDSSKQRNKGRSRRGKKVLKSLADQLKGKQGRFRQNLLGKRVDYSGRAVIINGPDLKLNECGIPKEMALELFKPFVLRELLSRGLAPNVKSAKYVVEAKGAEVWDILEELVDGHPVLLNRQPTLWRLGMQAFFPKLIEGNSIRLHLCVCPGYNADFDGDQMAVLLPLSEKSIEEAKTKMISTNNLRRPSDGIPFSVPTKIILFGIYYITSYDDKLPLYGSVFANKHEVYYALHGSHSIKLRQKIKVRINDETVETSAGRLIFNDYLPEGSLYVNEVIDKNGVNKILERAFEDPNHDVVVKLIDDLKDIGLKYGTISGHSVSLTDVAIPEGREELIQKGKDNVKDINNNYNKGFITEAEVTRLTEDVWNRITSEVDQLVWDNLPEENPIKVLIKSKATRASRTQVMQIAGIRGLVYDATGKVVSVPLLGNYKLGLPAMEYFIGARGARKGLVDKGLKTADAGYLTRKLVDVAQDVIIREHDCGSEEGRVIQVGVKTALMSFPERYAGRFLAQPIEHKGSVLFERGHLLKLADLEKLEKLGVERMVVRSPLGCQVSRGICATCYGNDIMTQKLVEIGTAVGVSAAQSIGEPGTQLTMRTFHTGGVAGKDITQGLPRIEELVEARAPKFISLMADITGKVRVFQSGDERKIIIEATDPDEEEQMMEYQVDPVAEIVVEDGQLVVKGDKLTSGHLNLTDLLRTVGTAPTKEYIIDEVQKVYASQGVSINEKHIESIVRQMFGHVKVDEGGDTEFLAGSIVTRDTFEEENERVLAQGGVPATAKVTLLGITKAALNTDSFLSAASFIQTSQVLTDAAASGKVDMLLGLKENVIIGRLIPTGERAKLEE